MADPNKLPVNEAALNWLRKAKEPPAPEVPHVLTLAQWGLENGAAGEWPRRENPALEMQVGLLLGWKPENAMAWLLSNPEGPTKAEQEANLLSGLKVASSPQIAAALVLNAVWSRQASENPALQPAASELT